MTTATIFQVMSMTKPVTGTGIMMLRDQGRLSLQDPVLKYIPEFENQRLRSGAKPARPVTIFDLMIHTSGMRARPGGSMKNLYSKLDTSLRDAVASFADEPLDFEPGARWRYSSMGIGTLGRIIEVVSGQPYETFITNRLLTPLAMNDSSFFLPADKQNRLAALYAEGTGGHLRKLGGSDSPFLLGGDPAAMRHGAKYPAPEFGLYSTASDLARFYQMFLNGGTYGGRRYLFASSVSMMTAVQTGSLRAGFLPGAGYGLTWEVIQESTIPTPLSPGTFGHGGIYGTHGWVDPNHGLVGVFLVQIANPASLKFKRALFQAVQKACFN